MHLVLLVGVTSITLTIGVCVGLVFVCNGRAVVVHVRDTVIVIIHITQVSQSVSVAVDMGYRSIRWAEIAGVAHPIPIQVQLRWIGNQRTVVNDIEHSIIVIVFVAGITLIVDAWAKVLCV
jgi:hypothetical protein